MERAFLEKPPGQMARLGGARAWGSGPDRAHLMERQVPKMKTKSGAKKRFKLTGTGKVLHAQRGKRHGMIKRTNKQIRGLRGTRVLSEADTPTVKAWLPYGL
jgi:large subunit ribosomal protein L35